MTDFQQYFDESHQLIRDSVRRSSSARCCRTSMNGRRPGISPRTLSQGRRGRDPRHRYPEAYGGSCEGDLFAKVAASEEPMRCGSGGLVAGLGSLDIGLPPVARAGPSRGARAGSAGGAARREDHGPGGHRALRRLRRGQPEDRAVRDGDHYRVSGSKTFITSGVRADYYTVAVRTGGEGFAGISLLLVEKGTAGFSVGRKLKKMGWWASDTAELFFDDCRVPAENLIGVENAGFACIMANFQRERRPWR
ncbi:acyl-CoA dehydrogenase family protein [Pseudomonas aeruginosa]